MVRPNLLRRVFAKAFRGLAGGGGRVGLMASGRKLRQCFVQRPQPGRFSGCVKHAGEDRGWLGPVLRVVEFLDAYSSGAEVEKRANELMGEVVKRFGRDADVVSAAVLRHLVKGRRDQAVMVMNAVVDGEGGDAGFWLVLAGVAQEEQGSGERVGGGAVLCAEQSAGGGEADLRGDGGAGRGLGGAEDFVSVV